MLRLHKLIPSYSSSWLEDGRRVYEIILPVKRWVQVCAILSDYQDADLTAFIRPEDYISASFGLNNMLFKASENCELLNFGGLHFVSCPEQDTISELFLMYQD